eukprot:CAMPEP_0180058016 /NCGR_PEP_ID=MMETSP0985-20121206/4789_1 /TAXON_ID=483367 /ORGANISM="non described non described, Strain CCMP 2436" /LENGTH=127 /DNA_ID=CAMNT_0021987955 /DNA_START=786 /DNA_END=1170 /DNA_ORIENTATION=+
MGLTPGVATVDIEVDPLKPAVIGGAGAWRTMKGKAKPPSTPQTDTNIVPMSHVDTQNASARGVVRAVLRRELQIRAFIPKADDSEHAREVPRLLEVTALVDAAHKAGQSLMPKPQSAGLTGAHLGSG